ncbi:MAG TPA: M20/M25/M40 family metallo-hydrolase [Rhizomicrobium sp.]|jgi:acetylornithine deacetylase/succinyl-diaminopimelate desuccinylase-like protein|nr:M20/M25/M40 family metallo-hydrolase [Rhizomicrobium sp.]
MDFPRLTSFMERIWDDEIIPVLTDYIRVPNKSPAFDADWEKRGLMEQVVAMFTAWAGAKLNAFPGASMEVVRLKGRTPLILIEVPGATGNPEPSGGVASDSVVRRATVLMYGHLDKQPEMAGWAEGTGPWVPVLKDDKLYGRGGADDGYAMFASLAALLALKEQNIPHARTVVLIEACEESGSPDLPFYVDHLNARIGTPDLVVCLDSGAGNYDQLWLTTSLRGMVMGNLTVRVLTEGVHSGAASGIVPSSFRILRSLLSRVEDEATGRMKLPELFVQIPPDRRKQAQETATILGDEVWSGIPFAGDTKPMAPEHRPGERSETSAVRLSNNQNAELLLEKTWRPQLAVTGMEGYPLPVNGGNVLLPFSIAKLSLRLPPTLDAEVARAAMKKRLEADPPYKAQVVFDAPHGDNGWNAPTLAPWLEASLNKASLAAFGKPVAFHGEGGSIPFMAMLGEKFPATQFVVTGVLGPHSNAHGPNEFLHIPFAKKLSAAIAQVLADHAAR